MGYEARESERSRRTSSTTHELAGTRNEVDRRFQADLLLEAEFLDKRGITTLVTLLKIAKMSAAIGHHLQKTAATVEILKIFLKVFREFLDFAGQHRNLYLGRAGVQVMTCHLLDDGGLYSFRKH
ncbi:MAG: hypothetical protein JWL82_396 [Parcubacteria group bacterium]|nr:hypothetical protein [Parcubacteria group bacterium]